MHSLSVLFRHIRAKWHATQGLLQQGWQAVRQRGKLAVHRANSRNVWVLVTIFLLLAALNGIVFAQSIYTLINREQWVEHTQHVQTRLADFMVKMDDAETGQRGYLLTGNTLYLQPYQTALARIDQDMANLRTLTSDNASQQQALTALQPLVTAKLAELKQTIALRQSGDLAGALRIINSNLGSTLMDQIRQSITSMQNEETQLLEQRHTASQEALTAAIVTFTLGLTVLCGFFLVAGRFIQLQMQQRERIAAERALQMKREQKMRKLAEDALRQRDEVFGIVAHELKNPITALLTSTQVTQRCLAKEQLHDERIPRFLETQMHQTRRLKRLIEDMLDTARITDGGFAVQRESMDLAAVLKSVVDELRLTTTDHTIDLQISEQPVMINGDRVRIEQVCYNLVLNAMKYSPEGGSVEITLQQDTHQAFLRVRDHGIGIPTTALPHLFERLYRAPNVTQYSVKGMGVGLYISQQIVQLHDGLITVNSNEGQGSEFCVTLPLLAQAPIPAASVGKAGRQH